MFCKCFKPQNSQKLDERLPHSILVSHTTFNLKEYTSVNIPCTVISHPKH